MSGLKATITFELTERQATGLAQLVDLIIWTDLSKFGPKVQEPGQLFQALLQVKRALEEARSESTQDAGEIQ